METLVNNQNLSKKDMDKLKKFEEDPLMSQLINKLIKSGVETALKESQKKTICPVAVKVAKKKALELLEKDDDKHELIIYQASGQKDQIFTQCTRPQYEDKKHC